MKKIFILLSRCLACSVVGLTLSIIGNHIVRQFEVTSDFWFPILTYIAPVLIVYIVFIKAYPLSKKKGIVEDTKPYQHCGSRQETASTVDSQNIESTSKNNPQEIDNTGATRIDYIALLLTVTIILVYDLTIGDYESGAITFGKYVGQFLLLVFLILGGIVLSLWFSTILETILTKLSGWRFKRRK